MASTNLIVGGSSKTANITIMTSIAGGPAQLDTTSNVQAFLTTGGDKISISPPAVTPSQTRAYVISPVAAGPFLITVVGPNGSQDTISGNVSVPPNSSTLTISIDP